VETKVCECCGTTITRKNSDRQSAWDRRKYCNYSCATTKRNLAKDPHRGNPVARCEYLLTRTVKNTTGCMEWQGSTGSFGYGEAIIDGRHWRVHRAIFNFLVDPVSGNVDVLHRCDNPKCINPDHLFVGTHSDNMKDMVTKGRGRNWGKHSLSDKERQNIFDRVLEIGSKAIVAQEAGVCLDTVYKVYRQQLNKQ
jgi:hypothetical protein